MERDPPGGLPLSHALKTYVDPEIATAQKDPEDGASHRSAELSGGPEAKQSPAGDPLGEAIGDLWTRLSNSELIAWAADGTPSALRIPVPAELWQLLTLEDLSASIVARADGRRFFGVKVYRAADIDEWRRGVPLSRAAELLAPESWSLYRQNYDHMFVIGDPVREQRNHRASKARIDVKMCLISHFVDSALELRTLRPPGDPAAKWTSLSSDVVEAMFHETVDIEASTIQMPSRGEVVVRAFLAGSAEGVFGPPEVGPPNKRRYIYAQVGEAWDALPDAEKSKIQRRGGKTEIAKAIQMTMPRVPLASVERELRHLRELPSKPEN